jgi:hypothetical protein
LGGLKEEEEEEGSYLLKNRIINKIPCLSAPGAACSRRDYL